MAEEEGTHCVEWDRRQLMRLNDWCCMGSELVHGFGLLYQTCEYKYWLN